MGDKGTILSTVVMTVIILIFGEITPKIIAKKIADRYVLAVAYPLAIIMKILKPAVHLVVKIVNQVSKLWEKDEEEPAITEEELVTIIESVEDDGIIDEEASDLLQSALKFSNIHVSEVITPRIDMVAIDIEDEMDEIIDIVLDSPYSRIPVYEETIDNIVGVLYVDHLLEKLADKEDIDKDEFNSILIDAFFVHQTMKLPEVFDILNKGRLQMAIVTDEFGGTLGCLTMEDVLEELVGEIWDEYDEIQEQFIEIGENSFEVSGELSLRDLAEHLDLDDDHFESEYITVGGWAVENFNGIPKVNDTFKYENLLVRTIEVDGLRVSKLRIDILPESDNGNVSFG
jgi:putative hemolysin